MSFSPKGRSLAISPLLLLRSVIAFFVLLSGVVAFVMYMNVISDQWAMEPQIPAYRPAVFQVTDLFYSAKRFAQVRGGAQIGPFYWAVGTLDGKREKLCLQGLLLKQPHSLEELNELVRIGATFSVMYNPNVEETQIEGRCTRVIAYNGNSDSFQRHERERIRKTWLLSFLPFGISVGALVITLFVPKHSSFRRNLLGSARGRDRDPS